MKRNIGFFEITKDIIDNSVETGDMSVLNALFKNVVVVSVSYHYPSNCFQYYGISPYFKEVVEGGEPETYAFTFHTNEDGTIEGAWNESTTA
jgi:hypothetical protein